MPHSDALRQLPRNHFAGVVLCILAVLVFLFVLVRVFRESPPTVAQNSVLLLQLNGDIPERAPVEVPFGALADRTIPTVADVWMLLRATSMDARGYRRISLTTGKKGSSCKPGAATTRAALRRPLERISARC
jgi:hypothetical protein